MYLRELQKEEKTKSYMDLHYYKYQVYLKFSSLISHLVFDVVLGAIILLILYNYTFEILAMIHYYG